MIGEVIHQAVLADEDLERVTVAGLGASQACLARVRSGFARVLASRGAFRFSASGELLNHLLPVMTRTMAVAHLMGERRSGIMEGVGLDRFSEVMRDVRAAGLGEELTRLQRGYAHRLYDSMRHLGASVDATTRATIASLIAQGEPPGRGVKILMATLDKLGVGGQSQSKLETIYRTETSVAYHAGRWQADQRDPTVWGYRYVTMRDDRVRPEHAALDGTTLPRNALFWKKYWPPCAWNCRCQVVTLRKKAKERLPAKIDGKVPLPDPGFRKNFGETVGPVVEFAFNPAQPRVQKGTVGGGRWVKEESLASSVFEKDRESKKWFVRVSQAERDALREWFSGNWKRLRETDTAGKKSKTLINLVSACASAPQYSGLAYRGLRLTGPEVEKLIAAKSLEIAGVSSFTTSEKAGAKFAKFMPRKGEVPVLLKAMVKDGRDISAATYRNESEIIVRREKFKVKAIKEVMFGKLKGYEIDLS
jgi:SPP1 gp7 family putative phage head morphogenesis protein